MAQVSAVNNNNHFLQSKATQYTKQATEGEDFLLLAGSKLSAKEIYNQELDLPLDRSGKHYDAAEVDNLFVIINGVFTSISEQAYRTDKSLKQLRADLEVAKANLATSNAVQTQMEQQLNTVRAQRDELQSQVAKSVPTESYQQNMDLSQQRVNNLSKQLEDRNRDYSEMLQSTSDEMQQQADKIEELNAQISDLRAKNNKLQSENNDLQNRPAETNVDSDLQREYDKLTYKYDSIQSMSASRIAELADEVSQLRAGLKE